MKKQIVIATSNAKKLIGIQSILNDMNVEILPQSHFKIEATKSLFIHLLKMHLSKQDMQAVYQNFLQLPMIQASVSMRLMVNQVFYLLGMQESLHRIKKIMKNF